MVVSAAWLVAAGPVHAVRASDMPPPTAESVRGAHPSRSAADRGREVREGTLSSVEADGGRVVIDGVRYRLVPGHTRLYRQGQRVATGQLAPGQRVGFAIAPHAPGRDDVLELLLIKSTGADGRDVR